MRQNAATELPIPDSTKNPAHAAELAALRTSTFVNPVGYIQRSGKGPVTEQDDFVEFDLEFEDEEWLRAHPRFGPDAPDASARLPRATLERMLDVLEKTNYAHKGQWHANEVLPAQELLPGLGEALVAERERFSLPEGLAVGGVGWKGVAAEVYAHWVARRKRLQKPLLRRFWPQPVPSDQNPHHTFRPPQPSGFKLKRTRRNELEVFKKLFAAHRDLQANLELLAMVIQREQAKLQLTRARAEIMEQQLYELTDATGVRRVPAIVEEVRRAREAAAAPAQHRIKIKPKPSAPGAGGEGGGRPGYGEGEEGGDERAAAKKRSSNASSGNRLPVPPLKKARPEATKPAKPAPPASGPARVSGGALSLPPHAGWPGFRLGAWAPPASLCASANVTPHVEDMLFEPEDALGLGAALGAGTGLLADMLADAPGGRLDAPSVSLRGTVAATIRGLLPSRGSVFPMDEGYVVPAGPSDKDLYFADVSLQRRMLSMRDSAGRVAGAPNWEEGLGTGLAAGLGAALAVDGAGWEFLGSRLGATVLPLDGLEEPVPTFLLRVEAEVRARNEAAGAGAGAPPASGAGAGAPPAAGAGEGAGAGGGGGGGAPQNKGATLTAEEVMEVLRFSGSDMLAAARAVVADAPPLALPSSFARAAARAREAAATAGADSGGGGGGGGEGGDADFLYRPRVGRGGRLILDRIKPGFRPDLQGALEEQMRVARRRIAAVREARRGVLASWGAPRGAEEVEALGAALPSCFTLQAVYRALLARGERGAGERLTAAAVREAAAGADRPFAWRGSGGGGGGGGAPGEPPFSSVSRVSGVATSYTVVPALPGAGALAEAARAGGAGGDGFMCAATAPPPLPFSALFSPALDGIVEGGVCTPGRERGGGEGGGHGAYVAAARGSGGGLLKALAEGAAATAIRAGAHLPGLRATALRFFAGLDPVPVLPKALPRVRAPAPVVAPPALADARLAELLEDDGSDDEEVTRGLLAVGAAGSKAWRDPHTLLMSNTLDAALKLVPLGQRHKE